MSIETIKYKGYNINIRIDDCAESPDIWCDEGLFLVAFHRQFEVLREDIRNPGDLEEMKEDYFLFPVSVYIHSGVSLSFESVCQWDSSWCVCILASKSEFPDVKSAQIAAESLMETWNDYLQGDVYWYSIEKAGFTDSCGGFYGCDHERSGLMEYARNAIDCRIAEELKKRVALTKFFIKKRVPLIYRHKGITA